MSIFVGEIIVSLCLECIKRKLLALIFHIMQSSVSATTDPLLQRELCTQKGKKKKFGIVREQAQLCYLETSVCLEHGCSWMFVFDRGRVNTGKDWKVPSAERLEQELGGPWHMPPGDVENYREQLSPVSLGLWTERRTSLCRMGLLLLARPTLWKRKAFSTTKQPLVQNCEALFYVLLPWSHENGELTESKPYGLQVVLVCLTNKGRKDARSLPSMQK